MEKQQVSDGNGGFAEVDKGQAVILTHLEYMKKDISDIKVEVSGLSDKITIIKEELIRVRTETDDNTLLRRVLTRSFVVSLVSAVCGFFAWMFGFFSKG